MQIFFFVVSLSWSIPSVLPTASQLPLLRGTLSFNIKTATLFQKGVAVFVFLWYNVGDLLKFDYLR